MKVNSGLRHLFVSQTRQKLLKLFFSSPSDIFYVRQLVRLSGEEINSVRRELANLASAGILLSETRSNRLFYWPNSSHPLHLDLLVLAHKSSGLAQALQNKRRSKEIKLLLYSYRFL